jgi:hypothetical protein
MPRTRIPVTIGDWETLTHSITPETTAGSPYLEQAHAKLQGFHEELVHLIAERDEHQARKQQATLRINAILAEGRRLATVIRKVLKEDLGIDNEELARFGIQPHRPKKRSRKSPASAGPADPADPAAK